MNANEPSEQETDGRTDIELTVLEGGGIVNVHRPESDRAHSVFVGADGGVLRCSCKGHHFRGECSHADAIAARPLVTASAQAAASAPKRVATDGGTVETTGSETDDTETCDECGSGERGPGGLADVADDGWNDYGALCHECVLSVGGPGEAPDDHGEVEA